ncbi:hypothetical protein ACH5RR_027329 [Cinchona calisaya]|uniref:J domain-containing protein required for chloroplast accumulation response 1 n=1 Tax=Cinchona calisaya TaxID=153742 RepID=A0ABD2Z8D1_9GENT
MERFSQKESVLLGYSPQRSLDNSMETSDANSDMDYSDVFGGPPRRFSIQETRNRYSFSEARLESDEDAVFSRSPWSGLEEKPVFGEESVNRKSYPSDDFFDDIFKGDEAKSRRTSRDFFASSPGSRILSPSEPLPQKVEPFSTSFPAQSSLPAKLTKPADYIYRHPFYRQSPLSHEVSHTSEESSHETESNDKDMGSKLKNNSQSKEVPVNSGQFHFSIYKWAGSGIPLLVPLGRRSKLRYKDRFKTERCSSSNGRIESDCIGRHLPTVEEHIISIDTESVTLKINNGKHDETSNDKKIDSRSHVEETHLEVPEPKFFESEGHAAKHSETISRNKAEEEFLSENETNVYGKSEKESSIHKGEAPKTELKPLHELLNDENQQEQGNENNVKIANLAHDNADVSTSPKKTDAKRTNSGRSEVTNAKKSSATNSGDAIGRSRVKGKVKEFVKMFNHEPTAQTKTEFGSKSSRWKGMDMNGTENGISTAFKTDEKVHMQNQNKIPEASTREDNDFNKNKVKQESHFKSSVHKPSGPSTNEKNVSPLSDSLPNNYGKKVENIDDSFHGYFLVEELTQIEDKDLQTSGVAADIQALNAKIQQWSNGRKGNIRSLLSTLQFVLWPESGWKPVPLVDLIEGSAVKRAYQRALLCLHPDKLQQKGAASHQKYIAEQVFDVLQEAWDHFNSLGAI